MNYAIQYKRVEYIDNESEESWTFWNLDNLDSYEDCVREIEAEEAKTKKYIHRIVQWKIVDCSKEKNQLTQQRVITI